MIPPALHKKKAVKFHGFFFLVGESADVYFPKSDLIIATGIRINPRNIPIQSL